MDTDEFGCPRCKTTKYRNPSLRLLVNSCGHSLCMSCMEVLFVKGSGPCPDCGIILRRTGFRDQLFDDPFVEREVDIRRRILKDYCKTESDFNTLREYNDYLEEIEHIVFNLVKNTDVIETNKKIEQYKKENADQIKRARIYGNPHIHELDAILEQERLMAEERNYEKTVLEKEEQMRRLKSKESFLDNLMFSSTDADSILTEYEAKVKQEELDNKTIFATKRAEFLAAAAVNASSSNGKGTGFSKSSAGPTVFSTGLSIGLQAAPLIPTKEELYVYEDVQYNHPSVPTIEEIINGPYLKFVRETNEVEKAGGYHIFRSTHCKYLDVLDPGNLLYDPQAEGVHASEIKDEVGNHMDQDSFMEVS